MAWTELLTGAGGAGLVLAAVKGIAAILAARAGRALPVAPREVPLGALAADHEPTRDELLRRIEDLESENETCSTERRQENRDAAGFRLEVSVSVARLAGTLEVLRAEIAALQRARSGR